MRKKFIAKNKKETKALADSLAAEILATKPSSRALVMGFQGELGSGKTTFIQFLAKGLGAKGRIMSPTFIFSRRYRLRGSYKNLWHFDVYRLPDKGEIKNIGLEEALRSPASVVLVEWADKVKKILPKETFWITLSHGQDPHERHLTFN